MIPVILTMGSFLYINNRLKQLDQYSLILIVTRALAKEAPNHSRIYWMVPRLMAWYHLKNSSYESLMRHKDSEFFLLSHPFDIEFGAALSDKKELVELLREKGFSVDYQTPDGCDAIHDALTYPSLEALDFLLPLVKSDRLRQRTESELAICRENPIYVACRLYVKQGKPEHLKAWQMLYQKVNDGQLPASPLTRETDCSPYASL